MEGDRVLLHDSKGRRYLVTLVAGSEWHSRRLPAPRPAARPGRGLHGPLHPWGHLHGLPADPGRVRPQDEAGAQVIYPKDLGPILLLADVFPGARVLESGVGSERCR
ncbi:MAG: hypothetical protein R2726_09640 [Acidimicrobiales bacterium]